MSITLLLRVACLSATSSSTSKQQYRSVTIPGATSATFTITPVNNSAFNDDTSVTVTASASGYTNGTAVINITNDDFPAAPIKRQFFTHEHF
ncbi:MAG: hypothetical protein R3E08_02425 [Thiotrichaceae bacterium]